MTGRSLGFAVLCAAVLAAPGCGGREAEAPPARPLTRALDWRESAGKAGERLIVHVATITVRTGGWSVRASVQNDTAAPLFVGRPHTEERGTFGLVAAVSARERGRLPPGLTATAYSPRLPRVLDPGERWSGTFSGRGVLHRGTRVRIALGTFWAYGGVRLAGRRHMLFRFVTDRAVTLE